jgi:hypothetical protein
VSRRHLIGLPKESPLRRAARIVDRSGVVDLLERWRREDRARAGAGLGGRPKHVSDRAVLVAWVALAIDLRPMIVIDMADLIATADTDTLNELGVVPGAIRPDWYSRVWRSLHSVLDLIDSHPIRPELGGDRRTKMTKAEFDALLARRDPEETTRKAERLHEFTNALIEASVQECPEDLLGRWKGNVVVDGTLVRAWGKHGTSKKSDWVASEPDGGWYCREGDHSDKRSNGDRVAWGWDATVVSMSPNTGPDGPEYPLLGLAVGVDRPGHRPGQIAAEAYASIAGRGHPTGLANGDGIYLGGSTPANYHHPARAAGYGLIGEYRTGTPAVTIAEQGAIQVDGSWYCPSMPIDLTNASVDKRSGKIDEETWRARIDRRTLYMIRPNGRIEPDGYQRFRCPASGRSATVACPLKGEPPQGGTHCGHHHPQAPRQGVLPEVHHDRPVAGSEVASGPSVRHRSVAARDGSPQRSRALQRGPQERHPRCTRLGRPTTGQGSHRRDRVHRNHDRRGERPTHRRPPRALSSPEHAQAPLEAATGSTRKLGRRVAAATQATRTRPTRRSLTRRPSEAARSGGFSAPEGRRPRPQ